MSESRKSPLERLRDFVAVECGGSKAEAARRIGCHSSYLVHLLAEGSVRRPGLDFAAGLQRATAELPEERRVLAVEWAEDPADRRGVTGDAA